MDSSFLKQYDKIEWDKIAKFRDLVSHHYEQVDHEVVFDICKTHIAVLNEGVLDIRTSLSIIETSEAK